MLNKLVLYFDVVLIDIIGMGGSSRAKDFKSEEFTPQDCVDYFVHYLERWR